MSLCKVTGFFRIAGGLRITLYHRHPYLTDGASTPSTTASDDTEYRFAHYNSTISSTRRPITFADIRAPEPINDDILSTKLVMFVMGTVFLQSGTRPSIIDATYLQVFPGDPNRPNYHSSIPRFPATHINAIGTIARRHSVQHDGSKTFTITISQFVREGVKRFKLASISHSSSPSHTLTGVTDAY
jgi:hypothetical protein